MMTQEEIELIRTILQDEVQRSEWARANDVSLGSLSLKYLNDAHLALAAFNRECHLLRLGAAPHDVDEFYKEEDE
jgi:hypothetical protein